MGESARIGEIVNIHHGGNGCSVKSNVEKGGTVQFVLAIPFHSTSGSIAL